METDRHGHTHRRTESETMFFLTNLKKKIETNKPIIKQISAGIKILTSVDIKLNTCNFPKKMVI